MQRYVAFLGGINLGRRRLAMSELKAVVEETGLEDVATFIASGNVIFRAGRRSSDQLEQLLEKQFLMRLGYPVATFVRKEEEISEILAEQPFRAIQPTNTLTVSFFKGPLPAEAARVFASIDSPDDEFFVRGRELYWRTKDNLSASTVWTLPQLKTLRLPASTMRNRNTLVRLAQKHAFELLTGATTAGTADPKMVTRRKASS